MSSVYQLHYADGTPLADVTIQWTSSTSTWADLSQTQNPVYFTKNSASASTTTSVSGVNAGNTIRGWKSNGGLRSRFVHPTGGTSVLDNVGTQITELEWALWGITSGSYWECISIPSGTSTEGVVTPVISLSQTQLVGSGWAAGTYTFRGPVGVPNETLQPGWVDLSVVVSSNGMVLENDTFVYGNYEFSNGSSVFEQLSLSPSSNKKAFCNFW